MLLLARDRVLTDVDANRLSVDHRAAVPRLVRRVRFGCARQVEAALRECVRALRHAEPLERRVGGDRDAYVDALLDFVAGAMEAPIGRASASPDPPISTSDTSQHVQIQGDNH